MISDRSVEQVVGRLWRWSLADAGLMWAFRAAAAGAGAVAAIEGWSHLHPEPGAGGQAVAAAAAAMAAAVLAWALTRPGPARVARIADARLGLDERLASALAFAGDAGDLPRRLQRDVVGRVAAIPARTVFPLGRHRRRAGLAAVCVVAAVAVTVTPNPQSTVLRKLRADRTVISHARAAVVRQLQLAEHAPAARTTTALEGALRQALAQLNSNRTPLQALASLSALSQQLAGLDDPGAGGRAAASARAGASLAGAPAAAGVAGALARGDTRAATAALDTLAGALPGLSATQRSGLTAGLRRASGAATANRALSSALGAAATALAAGAVDAAGSALRQAGQAVADASTAASLEQQVRAAEAAASQASAEAGSQATADAQGAGQGQGQAGGQGQGGGQGAGTGGQGAGTGGQGQGAGQGQGQGQGQGTGGQGRGTGGQGTGGTGGTGRGTAGAASQQVYVGGQPGVDASDNNPQPLGPGQTVTTSGYAGVLSRFEPVALQTLGRTVVSPTDQALVRQYFAALAQP